MRRVRKVASAPTVVHNTSQNSCGNLPPSTPDEALNKGLNCKGLLWEVLVVQQWPAASAYSSVHLDWGDKLFKDLSTTTSNLLYWRQEL